MLRSSFKVSGATPTVAQRTGVWSPTGADKTGKGAVLVDEEDVVLDRLWRERFGQPMPMMGAAEVAKRILLDNGVDVQRIESEIRRGSRS